MKDVIDPQSRKPLSKSGRYMTVASASAPFLIEATGLVAPCYSNSTIDLDGYDNLTLVNNTDSPIQLDYVFNARNPVVFGGAVEINKPIVVAEIQKSIQVTAQSTVEDGKMRHIVADTFVSYPDVVIPSGSVAKVIDPRVATNRKVMLQVISADWTPVRVGHSSAIGSQSVYVRGKSTSPGTFVTQNSAALFVRNEGATEALITVTEEYKL